MAKLRIDIRPILRLWRQRRRKKKIQERGTEYFRTWLYWRPLLSRRGRDLVVPMKPCSQCQYGVLASYRELLNWRGVGVHYTLILNDTATVECNTCPLRAEVATMKEQEERMMRREELIEPDNAIWRVRLRLLRGETDCEPESQNECN